MISLVIFIVLVLALAWLTMPPSVRQWLRRLRPRRRSRGRGDDLGVRTESVGRAAEATTVEAAEDDRGKVSLEDREVVLAQGRFVGLVDRTAYHDEMSRIAHLDEERRPLRMPRESQ